MALSRAPAVALSGAQRRVLEQLVRAAGTAQAVSLRARLVLAAAAGASNRGLAQQLGVERNTAQKWRDRWVAAADALAAAEVEGGDGDDRALVVAVRAVLADAPRPGGPATFTPEQLCQIMAIACEPPGDSGRPLSHWTSRELAEEAVARDIVSTISARTVGRFLVSGGGRAAAAPEPVLAHAPRARSRGAHRAD